MKTNKYTVPVLYLIGGLNIGWGALMLARDIDWGFANILIGAFCTIAAYLRKRNPIK